MIRRCLVAWCLVGWLATPAFAQDTGGSFGGGDWGSGSSDDDSSDYGSSSSDYGSSSSDDDDDDSSDYGGSSDDLGGGGGDDAWTCPVMGVLFFGFMFLVLRSSDRERRRSLDQASRAWTGVDVAALRLGLDWRARKHVQGRLEELASSGDTTTKAGRARLLRETVALLEGARIAWLYTDVVNHQPMNQAQAQGIFQQLAVDARARFELELVRVADGRATRRSPRIGQRARPEEGPGVVVITLVVAARRELLDVIEERDAHQVQRLLGDLRAVTEGDLIALEVIWSPAAEDDRMSTAELEARYPELARFEERTIGGRVFCHYCLGPFADELPKCPHCGAPHARGETVTL